MLLLRSFAILGAILVSGISAAPLSASSIDDHFPCPVVDGDFVCEDQNTVIDNDLNIAAGGGGSIVGDYPGSDSTYSISNSIRKGEESVPITCSKVDGIIKCETQEDAVADAGSNVTGRGGSIFTQPYISSDTVSAGEAIFRYAGFDGSGDDDTPPPFIVDDKT